VSRILFFIFLLVSSLFSKDITPSLKIEIKGDAQDIVFVKERLYIASDKGEIFRYRFSDQNLSSILTIPQIKDFTGENIDAKIFSLDVNGDRMIFVSDSGIGGYSNLWLHEANSTKKIIDHEAKLPIIKAKFIDKDHALLGLLSSEAILYDIKNKKIVYRVQLDNSKFSDFALNEDKTKAAFSSESGIITVLDLKSGKIIKKLKGINRDNVYKVAFVKDIITGAGKDRRGSIYHLSSGRGDFLEGKFFIFVTALSPDAKKVAFTMDENSDISIYNLESKSKIFTLKGQKGSINNIIFVSNNRVISSSDDSVVLVWDLKE
jgi:hypothetical protein